MLAYSLQIIPKMYRKILQDQKFNTKDQYIPNFYYTSITITTLFTHVYCENIQDTNNTV